MAVAVLDHDRAIFAEREFDVDRFSNLGGERLPQQWHVTFVDPIFEKTIRRLDGRGSPIHANEIQRADPGFEADLAELIAHAIARTFPYTVHLFPSQKPGNPIARLRV